MHICKTAGYYLNALIRRKTLNINPRTIREKSYTKVVKLRGGQHEVISPAWYCPLCFHKNDFLWACSLMQDGSKWYLHLFVFQLKGPWLIDSQKRNTRENSTHIYMKTTLSNVSVWAIRRSTFLKFTDSTSHRGYRSRCKDTLQKSIYQAKSASWP